jgi:hypothetical protein
VGDLGLSPDTAGYEMEMAMEAVAGIATGETAETDDSGLPVQEVENTAIIPARATYVDYFEKSDCWTRT